MRTFILKRQVDLPSRNTGKVAEGVVFPSGKVVVEWLSDRPSIGIYDSIEKMLHVHCMTGTAVEFRS